MNKKLIATVAATTLGGVSLLIEDQIVKADDTSASNQTATTNATTHTVKAGDTLSSIATKYQTTVANLVKVNGISNPNLIIVGQTLTVGGNTTSTSTTTSATTQATTATSTTTVSSSYTVKSGDTVGSIASRYGVSVSDIQKWNNLSNVNLIFIGQKLAIQANATTTTTNTSTTSSSTQQTTNTTQTGSNSNVTNTTTTGTSTYTVKAGDTIAKIANQFGTTVAKIQSLNNLSNVNLIFVNQTLKISGTVTNSTTTSTSQSNTNTNTTNTGSTNGQSIYTVKSGDTIANIANTFGVTINQIKQWNNLANIHVIYVNQKLVVAGSGSNSQSNSTTSTNPSTNTSNTTNTNTNTTTPVVSADATLNALNALRASKGLNPVSWDAGLAAAATNRAQQILASNYTIPNDHWHTAGEVLAFFYSPGTDVINAWFTERNMISASGTGHRDWELNPSTTKVGFGYAGQVIVGRSN
ncbi:LysM peptidoglycan-binding domain-containing protein [Enterococcus camelliae]|uniref:LysM peptidoglycan-binding domain-containing protein n=1 Tax=Enterococcus camelliae TaxID=453959 RepID=A0ABW5TIY7_9ENTE